MAEEEDASRREQDQDGFAGEIDGFLAYLEGVRRYSPETLRAYRTDLSAYLSWCRLEGVCPHAVSHRELRRYLLFLTKAGYASRTISRHLSALRCLYRWLAAEGRIESDAADALASPKTERRLPRTLTDDEAERLIESCPDTAVGLRDRAFLELLYATGARISEASALDVSDVDSRQMLVHLFGKGSKERIVPIYRAALESIERYCSRARPCFAAGHPEERALFVSSRGNRMSAAALRRRFDACLAAAGLDPSLTPHAMRHTFATELLTGGADMRTVQELLGHESLATTQIYTHLSVERLKEATHHAHPRG